MTKSHSVSLSVSVCLSVSLTSFHVAYNLHNAKIKYQLTPVDMEKSVAMC